MYLNAVGVRAFLQIKHLSLVVKQLPLQLCLHWHIKMALFTLLYNLDSEARWAEVSVFLQYSCDHRTNNGEESA